MRWLDGITDVMDVSLSSGNWWTGKPGVLQSMWSQRVGHNLGTEQQQREMRERVGLNSDLGKNRTV